MNRTSIRSLLAIAVLMACAAANAATIHLRAHITGAQEAPPTGSPATGTGVMTFDTVTRLLSWSISYSGLQGTISDAHFHGPTPAGVSAAIVVPIGAGTSPRIGSATLTAPQAAQLLAGQYYINIHSSSFGDGEIRGQVVRVRGDFDADGKADVLWHHAGTGNTHLWFMDGISIKDSAPSFTLGDIAWRVQRTGDFDGDGTTDILWRHSLSGEVYVWLMNGAAISSSGSVFVVSDLAWQIAGVGDFDGDGRADLFWRHAATGETHVWLMNGTSIASSASVFVVADLDWQVAGVGDFDGDGKADVLWRHASTGNNYIWRMNGLALAADGLTFAVPDAAWKVAGIGDADGDGRADIFWRHDVTGQNFLWHMAGMTLASSGLLNDVPDLRWRLVSVADHDGDGRADLFWRHAQTGDTYAWQLNGFALGDNAAVFPLADMVWDGTCPTASCTGTALSLVPSRLSGVAPLAVFFDTEGTTAAGITRPFHDVEYRWNFGDPGSGTWATGARPGANSRNNAAGPVATHVFENPGVYNVTVTAFDGKTSTTSAVQITVSDPETVFATNTTCFSNDADFTGCPSASRVTTTNLTTALANAGSARRLLFHRGDTFTIGSSARITSQGPGIVGAFGTGAAPVFQGAGGGTGIIQVSSSGTPNLRDWRIVDVALNSTGGSGDRGMHFGGGATQITLLRVNVRNTGIGINMEAGFLTIEASEGNPEHSIWDQVAIVDSDIRDMQDNAGLYVASRRFSLLGSTVRDIAPGTTGHILRFPYLAKAVLSNNTLARSTSPEQTIKLHAPPFRFVTGNTTAGSDTITNYSQNGEDVVFQRVVGPGIPPNTFVESGTETTIRMSNNATVTAPNVQLEVYGAEGGDYSQDIVISDNSIIGSATQSWTVTLAPQSTRERKEDLRNIIVERNWFHQTGSGTQVALLVDADNVTIRNNLCDMGGSSFGACFMMARERNNVAHGPGATNVRIYNNTAFSNSGSFTVVDLRDDTVNNITVQNNLAYKSPSGGTNRMIDGPSITGLVTCASCNSSNLQITGTSPNFTATPPTSPAHFKPTSGYALGSGIVVPVWSDFFLVPQPATRDMGAILH